MKTAMETAVAMLSRREHAVAEVRKKLLEKGFGMDEVAETIEKLVERNYLNEARYVAGRVGYRQRVSGWGAAKIRAELLAVGVEKGLVEEALQGGDAGDVALQKAVRKVAKLPPDKAVARLLRMGFGFGEIKQALGAAVEVSDDA